jgi:hypothetical protein
MRTLPFLLLLLSAQSQDTLHVYLDPAGDDAGPGTEGKPVASPQRARDAVRRNREGRPAVIHVRDGTYFLAEPLVLGPEDSRTTWRAGGRAVFSAGSPVRGWKVEGNRWEADLDGAPRQLWVNGRRAARPRLPREGFFRVAELPDLRPETPWHEGQTRFRFAEGDLKASWANLADVDLVAVHFWIDSRMPVTAIDEATRTVQLGKRSTFRLTDDHTKNGARYWVENVREALGAPGEWYHDRAAKRVTYLPLPGEDPAKSDAVVPRHRHVLRLEGRPEAGQTVDDVTFKGVVFSHTEAYCPPSGNWPKPDVAGPVQAAFTAPGAVVAVGARRCVFEDGAIEHVGGYGIELTAGCRENRISRMEIHDLGAGGVKIGEARNRKEEGLRTSHNEVTDCRIHHGGQVWPAGIGVWVGHSAHNRLAHNHVHHFYYSGFSIGWSWGYGESGAHHNAIEFNRVHDIGRGMLSDMGGIYTLGASPGTVIRNNVFHDVESHGYGGWGIYFDEGTTGVVAENNLVYRCKSNGFHQHYGKENVLRNNVFALNRESQIARTREEKHLTLTVEGNVVYGPGATLLSGNWNGDQFRFARNVYWPKGPPEAWAAMGLDKDSVVADPLFVDPEKSDFTLRPESPALKLGFRPLDLSKVGPRAIAK